MNPPRLRVAYFSPFVPFGRIGHAGGRFLHHYLIGLSESVDITLVAPGSAANRAALADPETTPVRVHLVPVRPQPRSKIGYLPRLLANSLSGVTPGWQVLRGFRGDPDVWSIVARSDLVELGWAWNLAFVPDVRKAAPKTPITAFEHDVLTESLLRRARQGYLHERTLGWIRAMRAKSLEPNLLNQCDTAFVFSDRDRGLLQDLGVTRPIVVVDPHVERRQACGPPAPPPTVLFVGAMERPENHQGALWFIDKVWPTVEHACPAARLVIAGNAPPAPLVERATRSVQVTGYVSDLDSLYRQATVFVAPNLTGAGVKFKVLDAMSYGLAVVATPIAAEGIVERGGREVFGGISREAQHMAANVIALIQDPSQARLLGEKARSWVREEYDFTRTISTVFDSYCELTGR